LKEILLNILRKSGVGELNFILKCSYKPFFHSITAFKEIKHSAHVGFEVACHLLARWFAELFFDPEDGTLHSAHVSQGDKCTQSCSSTDKIHNKVETSTVCR
jgi:hypothetical protein